MSQLDTADELFCPGCGYSLRGIESARCPECGVEIDRGKLAESHIPWTHRAEIGWPRAFLRTIWMVMRCPGVIGREVVKPIHYRDAQLFRWLVIAAAFVPLCAWALIWRGLEGDELVRILRNAVTNQGGLFRTPIPFSGWFDLLMCIVAGVLVWPVIPVAIAMFAASVTGVASYFSHPRDLGIIRQNRAVALSYYASAPLAMLIFPAVLIAPTVIMKSAELEIEIGPFQLKETIKFAAGVSLFVIVLSWCYATLRILAITTNSSAGRIIGVVVGLPPLVTALTVLTLGIFPGVCGFVRLVIESYWS